MLAGELNVRAGPGLNPERVGSVSRSDVLEVIGQSASCAWLQVKLPGGGWISGALGNVRLDARCSAIAEGGVRPKTSTIGRYTKSPGTTS